MSEIPTSETARGSVAPIDRVEPINRVEPVKKGNRGFGVLIVVVATIAFAVLYGVLILILENLRTGTSTLDFLGDMSFYVPPLFFFVGFLLLTLLANRASWWVYVFGSLLVALFVYFGTIATGLLSGGIVLETPDGAARLFGEALINPYVLAAAFLSREVAVWYGFAIAARGRRVRARNAAARERFAREFAPISESLPLGENDSSVSAVRQDF